VDSGDGTGADDCTVRLWDAGTGTAIATLHEHTGPVYSVTFIPHRQSTTYQSDDRMGLTYSAESLRSSVLRRDRDSDTLTTVVSAIHTDN